MFESVCLISSIALLLLHWYESRMFKLQRWWKTKEFNVFCDCWEHFWSLILEFHWWKTRVFNKSLMIIGNVLGLLLWNIVLFHSFSSFVLHLACAKKNLIKGTWKATRVQGEEFSTILFSIVLCLGSFTLEFHFVSFFRKKFAPCFYKLF